MIASQFLVYVFDVFLQSAATDEGTGAFRTGQACASVYGFTVRDQLAFHPKQRSTVNAQVSEITVGQFRRKPCMLHASVTLSRLESADETTSAHLATQRPSSDSSNEWMIGLKHILNKSVFLYITRTNAFSS